MVVLDGETSVVDEILTTKGDIWTLSVTPSDGLTEGPRRRRGHHRKYAAVAHECYADARSGRHHHGLHLHRRGRKRLGR